MGHEGYPPKEQRIENILRGPNLRRQAVHLQGNQLPRPVAPTRHLCQAITEEHMEEPAERPAGRAGRLEENEQYEHDHGLQWPGHRPAGARGQPGESVVNSQ